VTRIEVNGTNITIIPTISRFKKTAFVISEKIYHALSSIGIAKEFITLNIPRNPLKYDTAAEIAWVVNGEDHYYSCNTQETYRDNLGVISKVIIQDAYAIRNGMKSFGQVMNQFKIGYDESGDKIRSPREILGVPDSMNDLDYIRFKYKQKAKELHPDTGGDPEEFQELQEAYDSVKKELED